MSAQVKLVADLKVDDTEPNGSLTGEEGLVEEGVRRVDPGRPRLVRYVHPTLDVLHRLHGPALKDRSDEQWFQLGNLHRDGGPAFTECVRDLKEWWRHGRRHRLDGPAVTVQGESRGFWVDGRRVDTDPTDRAVLEELYAAGPDRVRELELVLSSWQPDGPSVGELLGALRAALVPPAGSA